MASPFRRVAEAVTNAAESILRDEGVRHVKHGESIRLTKEWNSGFLCPLECGDKSGSASISRSLALKCHQCGASMDVFTWMGKRRRMDPWDVCKDLAAKLNISLKVKKVTSGRLMPKRMTADILAQAQHELLESDQAKSIREFLEDRKLGDLQALVDLDIGFLKGYLIFAQRDENGDLLERYRGYAPGGVQPWRWFGVGSGGPGVWPCNRPAPEESKVLILEGEWDALTALVRLRLHNHGWIPCTFTAGVSSSPPAHLLPKWMHGREVHLCPDNDTFQGKVYQDYVVVTKPGQDVSKARHALMSRLSAVLERVCPTLESVGCEVFLRACPLSPKEFWGGDLRDWVDQGGRDLNDWKTYAFHNLPPLKTDYEVVPFDEVFRKIGNRVKTVVQVDSISNDDVIIPEVMKLECPMGTDRACGVCPAARNFPDQIIYSADYQREFAQSLRTNAEKDYLLKNVVQRPRGCPRAELVPIESHPGSSWTGIRPATNMEEQANRVLPIVSDDPPSLTGDIEVIGTVYSTDDNKAFLRAEKAISMDKEEIDLRPYYQDLRNECPWNATRVEEIESYMDRRWRDFSHNVTKIHGRREFVIAHDLLSHSVSELRIKRNKPQRGWLDIAIFGHTRTGKTVTFEALLNYHGLGYIHAAVSNASRPGVVMGTDNHGLLRPGLFPRCHRKMLVIDEWHFLVKNAGREHPASWIQSARDSGYASSAKISGVRKLPSKVRFCTISNWTREMRHAYEFDCEHLIGLYGSPEAIARLDFALAVNEQPSQEDTDIVPQFWTVERTRALILRAWSQDADMVKIEPEAIRLAEETTEEWREYLDTESVPLFTPEEKTASIIRIATACANVCFSHDPEEMSRVIVRPVHVQWAIEWLRYTWRMNGYETYSEHTKKREKIQHPFQAEQHLVIKLALEDMVAAETVLSHLIQPFSAPEFVAVTGLEMHEATKWLSHAIRLRLLKRIKKENAYNIEYRPTRDGHALISSLVRMATDDPEEYVDRHKRLSQWYGQENPAGMDPLCGTRPDDEAVPF